ncbi:MAG: arsenate reductase [Gammaproteobacteria bacterium]|nr:arsenate reductase [Gammaproteobacteria bacterium]
MKKARKGLDEHGVEYQFHDFKKSGLDAVVLNEWVSQLGWETLLNRRGMMWRKLDDTVKENIDEASASQVMLETPTIIKRPVLELDGKISVGFKPEDYQRLFD